MVQWSALLQTWLLSGQASAQSSYPTTGGERSHLGWIVQVPSKCHPEMFPGSEQAWLQSVRSARWWSVLLRSQRSANLCQVWAGLFLSVQWQGQWTQKSSVPDQRSVGLVLLHLQHLLSVLIEGVCTWMSCNHVTKCDLSFFSLEYSVD